LIAVGAMLILGVCACFLTWYYCRRLGKSQRKGDTVSIY